VLLDHLGSHVIRQSLQKLQIDASIRDVDIAAMNRDDRTRKRLVDP
jgi:hypothetical protein